MKGAICIIISFVNNKLVATVDTFNDRSLNNQCEIE